MSKIDSFICVLGSYICRKKDSQNHINLYLTRVATFTQKKIGVIDNYMVLVRTSASQSVDLGFIPLVESFKKTLKNGIHSFPAWCSAFSGGCEKQACKFACCVLGQDT